MNLTSQRLVVYYIRSSKKGLVMKLSYRDQILRKIRAAAKKRSFPEVIRQVVTDEMAYYMEALNGVACVSWEQFKGSWAGQEWLKKRAAG